jgi:large subunit ribosomal protein L4
MIEFSVKDQNNQEVGSAELSDTVFGRKVRTDLLAMAIRYQMAKRAMGNATTKNRAAVRGGGKKPYRQKGTGAARQGTRSAPHYRGGGVVFGPSNEKNPAIKLPKKVRRLALQTAISTRREEGGLIILDDLVMAEIKTKAMRQTLESLELTGSVMIVLGGRNEVIEKSARNLPNVTVIPSEGVNVLDLLNHDHVVMTQAAVKALEERLG